MPIQTSYDLKPKEDCLKALVTALKQSDRPKKNARNLKEFVGGCPQEVREHYADLFKHKLLENFNDLISGDMTSYDAGDIIILADKVEIEEDIENRVYDELKIELDEI